MYKSIIEYNLQKQETELNTLRERRSKVEDDYNKLSQENDARENAALHSTSQKLRVLNKTVEIAQEIYDNLVNLNKKELPERTEPSDTVEINIPYLVEFEDGDSFNIIICEEAIESYLDVKGKQLILCKEADLVQQILGKKLNALQGIKITEA